MAWDRRTAMKQRQLVHHWLGFGVIPPEGLHGPRRASLVRRYTRLSETAKQMSLTRPPQASDRLTVGHGRSFVEAVIKTYPASRELHVMRLLRQQQLDDALWRQVYAVMVTGAPVMYWSLAHSLSLLTYPEQEVADRTAVALYRVWMAATASERKQDE